jgi:hypothetical protein
MSDRGVSDLVLGHAAGAGQAAMSGAAATGGQGGGRTAYLERAADAQEWSPHLGENHYVGNANLYGDQHLPPSLAAEGFGQDFHGFPMVLFWCRVGWQVCGGLVQGRVPAGPRQLGCA